MFSFFIIIKVFLFSPYNKNPVFRDLKIIVF